jgi:hypothetical protein
MPARRQALCALVAVAGLAGCLPMSSPLPVLATTGPTNYLPLSPYHVPEKLMPLYRGQYILARAARGARLSGGALGIEINPYGYLYGIGQFYAYDAQGYQTSWTALLYNFHLTSHGVMIVDLLGQTGRPLLGRLFVSRTKQGGLVGQIKLGSHRYSIRWRKFSNQ